MSEFHDDISIDALDSGVFGVDIRDRWCVGPGANGGYISALFAAALLSGSPDDRPLRSMTAHFLRPPVPGPATITVQPVRVGRGLSVLDARLQRDGVDLAVARAVTAVPRSPEDDRLSYNDRTMPRFGPPEQLPREDAAAEGMPPLRARYETRYAVGGERGASDRAESSGWMRTIDRAPIDAPLAVALSDAFVPAPMFRIGAAEVIASTVDLTVHLFSGFAEPIPGWAAVTNRSTVATDGYVETDTEVWSEEGQLLAQATQMSIMLTAPR